MKTIFEAVHRKATEKPKAAKSVAEKVWWNRC